jgi:hypothetical protein
MKSKRIKLNEKQELIRLHSFIKKGKIRDRIKSIILLNNVYSIAELEKILLHTVFLTIYLVKNIYPVQTKNKNFQFALGIKVIL